MKVLVIGLGSIGRRHCTVLKEINPSVEIYALRSNENADEFESVKNIYNLNEIKFTPDFFLISSPTANHVSDIKQVIDLGRPMFIEKPISHDLEQATALFTEIEKKEILTYVGCNLRFHPCFEFLKQHLPSESRINEVNIYCGTYLPEWRDGNNFKKRYSAHAEMGGGVHLDLIHEIDYTYWLFGKPDISKKLLSSSSTLKVSAIDYANYALVYPNFVANIVLNYFRRDAKRTLEIVFEDKTWVADLLKNKITEGDKIIFHKEIDQNYTYKKQVKYFLDCIQRGKSPMNSFKEALEVLKICLG
ncbi:MAG: oxidoreductase [Flavobacteriales bacterium]|nr:MAG: oxidoreductase [Flavobacteriales bacterium]